MTNTEAWIYQPIFAPARRRARRSIRSSGVRRSFLMRFLLGWLSRSGDGQRGPRGEAPQARRTAGENSAEEAVQRCYDQHVLRVAGQRGLHREVHADDV